MADYRQLAGALTNSDTIQATPRNPVLGGVADLLGMAYKLPEMPRMGVPGIDFLAANRKKVMDLLGMGDVQKTADALSYGNAVGTGSGMTYRPKDETIGAALTVAPMVAPAARMVGKGAVETGRFVAPKAGQLAEQYMVNTGGILPLDVYHGTPHTLPPTPRNPLGEFDASKIGTGEGAQAYGHGIYVAESPAVATGYREKLSQNRLFDSRGTPFDVQANLSNPNVRAVLNKTNGDIDAAIARARQSIESIPGTQGAEYAAKDLETLNAIKASGGLQKQSGNLYKVDLPDEKIAQMLDFDKPLSQQKNILDALTPENMGLTLRPTAEGKYMAYLADGKPIGLQVKGVTPEVFREKWISRLREMGDLEGGAGRAVGYLGGTTPGDLPPLVAKALRQAGIPGIKYLDEGSRNLANTYIVRNPQGGENVFSSKAAAEAYVKKYPEDKLIEPKVTRNFVVFPGEEKSMTILERNAQKK